jgi:hypothetical protein
MKNKYQKISINVNGFSGRGLEYAAVKGQGLYKFYPFPIALRARQGTCGLLFFALKGIKCFFYG